MLKTLPLLLCAAGVLLGADSPVASGSKLTNHGNIGAGEGPAWSPGGELYFTGGGRIYKRDAKGGVTIVRDRPNGANGLLFDREGRMIACEPENRRVTRTERNGSVTVLADNYNGKKFNSPNDLTIDSKGRIYFSDPRYGKRDGMEILDERGQAVEGVYRVDAPGKVLRIITRETERPNGLLVSPDSAFLYVADNNNNNVNGARKLWRFRLKSDGSIDAASKKLIFDWENGRGPDGLKMDRKGRLYVAGGRTKGNSFESADKFKGGVYVLSPEGRQIDLIAVPVDEVTNCAFGGADRKTLYITAGGTLWSVGVDTPGL